MSNARPPIARPVIALLTIASLAACHEDLVIDDFTLNAVRIEGRLASGDGTPVGFAYVEAVADVAARPDGAACRPQPSSARPDQPLAFTTTDSIGRWVLTIRGLADELCVRLRATERVTGATIPPVLVERVLDRLVMRREGPWGEVRDTVVVELVLPPAP